MEWTMKYPGMTIEHLGYIPHFLHNEDQRPAKEQIDAGYISGWIPFKGFTMTKTGDLTYPGDPPMHVLAETKLRDEIIRFYPHSWLAIVQPDGSFEVARLD